MSNRIQIIVYVAKLSPFCDFDKVQEQNCII